MTEKIPLVFTTVEKGEAGESIGLLSYLKVNLFLRDVSGKGRDES